LYIEHHTYHNHHLRAFLLDFAPLPTLPQSSLGRERAAIRVSLSPRSPPIIFFYSFSSFLHLDFLQSSHLLYLFPLHGIPPTPRNPLNKHKHKNCKVMDHAYVPTTEDTLKFFNFPEWTGLDGRPVETALLSNGSNGKTAPCQVNGFELGLTLPEDQRSPKTLRSHYGNLS